MDFQNSWKKQCRGCDRLLMGESRQLEQMKMFSNLVFLNTCELDCYFKLFCSLILKRTVTVNN